MTTTDSGHHRLEVESLTAKAVANKILSTLEVDPSEVTRFDITIESDGGNDETETVIRSSGPRAGQIVSPMLKNVDWNQNVPHRIVVDVVTTEGNDNDGDDEEGEDEEDDSGGVAEIDKEEVVSEDDPSSMTPGTNLHAALTALAAYIHQSPGRSGYGSSDGDGESSGPPAVTVGTILEVVDVDLSMQQLSDALRGCVDRGLVDNVAEDGPGIPNRYHLNTDGWLMLRAAGPSERVEEFPFDELLDERVGDTTETVKTPESFTYTADRGEYAREEPDVDEPVPVAENTRPHQGLTVLAAMAEEYGDDHWVSAEGVYKFPVGPDWPNQTSASKSLSELFLKHALCERVKNTDTGAIRCLYRINEAGFRELRRIGDAEF